MSDNREELERVTRRRANLLDIRYFDSREIKQHPIFKDVFNLDEMKKNRIVVLGKDQHQMVVGITDRSPRPIIKQLKDRFPDLKLSFVMISEAGFKEFMLIYDPPEEVQYDDIEISKNEKADIIAEVSKTINGVGADDILRYLIEQAHRLNASDIHLENQETSVRVRFRVDGVLHKIADISHDKYRQLSSSIAIAANIGTEAPVAQTGHIEYRLSETSMLNMRIETVPALYGQDAVIRLFSLDKSLLELDNLGLREQHVELIKDVISHPTGLVLAVGPTGSGKTTTLYSILNSLNVSTKKIITLEDPVEYSVEGIIQIPVRTNNNETFADKLRSVLRLDPDIVMVGEIRDVDTARTALQASLSGHLVLSTFHASDTAAALDRMLEMVGDNPLFSSAIRLIIAQRLVRRLHDETKKPLELDEKMLSRLKEVSDGMPKGFESFQPSETTFYQEVESEESPFGFDGRMAVMEVMTMSPQIREILKKPKREILIDDIRKASRQDGMLTMLEDAVLHASKGETTLSEVFRVVG